MRTYDSIGRATGEAMRRNADRAADVPGATESTANTGRMVWRCETCGREETACALDPCAAVLTARALDAFWSAVVEEDTQADEIEAD